MAEMIGLTAVDAVDRAVSTLEAGGTVVLPTETVYGIAALPSIPRAIRAVFELKERPAGMHLAVLVASVGQVPLVSDDARPEPRALMQRFWPGPLTLVLPRATSLVSGLGDGDGTVGVRCPDHPFPRSVAERVGPIATTSANLHGQPTPTTAAEVARALPGATLVVDGGPIEGPGASTVVDLTGAAPRILRSGPVTEREVLAGWSGGAVPC